MKFFSFIETSQEHTTLEIGTLDVQLIRKPFSSAKLLKRQLQYHKWSENERYNVVKYAGENGDINALRKFKTEFPKLSESTVRTFKNNYYEELSRHAKEELEMSQTQVLYTSRHTIITR